MARLPVPALFGALLLAASALPGVGAAATCPPSNSHVWFLGVAHDSAERDDFKHDVLNFEAFRTELRDVYCIPASQTDILAFDGAFTLGSTNYSGYTPATEDNLKDTLADFAADANDHTDSILFFFLSSHGMAYSWPLSPCPVTRAYGSYSALAGGSGQDGTLYDCELGSALNGNFDDDVRMFIAVDCSFCGGFSDSLTAASGTLPDAGVSGTTTSSGVPGPNRVVMTGCAMTTECFGGGPYGGSYLYDNMRAVVAGGTVKCDGWSAPGFPTVQGIDVPVFNRIHTTDGVCTASEWFFAALWEVYIKAQPIGIQQQFRIKYNLPADIQVMG